MVLLDLFAPSGTTLDAIRLRLACEVGLALSVTADGMPCNAALPSGPTLDKLDRAIHEAVQFFLQADPNWSFLTQTLTIQLDPNGAGPDNIAGDPSRYRLPNAMRGGPQQWMLSMRGSVIWSVRDATVSAVLAQQARGPGTPYVAAIRPIPNPEDALGGAAWEVILGPKPGEAFTLTGAFSVNWVWSEGAERHIFGAEHDLTLYLLSVWAFRRADGQTGTQAQANQAAAFAALNQSRKLDKDRRPKSLGPVSGGLNPRMHLPGGYRPSSDIIGIVNLPHT